MTENGSTSVHEENISRCIAQVCEKGGNLIMSKGRAGLNASLNQPLWMQLPNCRAAQLSEKIAESARRWSCKTRFCGQAHKLLPKVSFRVVLSAPKKRSAEFIGISISNFES